MSNIPGKREPPSSMPEGSGLGSPYKRSRVSYADDDNADHHPEPPAMPPNERPRNHPLYGQKSAFPGLEVDVEGELFYGPAEDGLEYLRMVRSEANSLPLLFTAPKIAQETQTTHVEQTGTEDKPQDPCEEESIRREEHEGTYVDGVFVAPVHTTTATATTHLATSPPPSAYPEAQQSYYNLLHHRFLLLRSILKCTPPPTSISALDDSHPISLPRHSKVARKEWRRLLLSVDPQTVQLACMDMESVLGVLGIMARLMSENVRSRDEERVRRIGAWAWGLLGKCREVGQLGTEEVGEIRDLGKRAVKILRRMREDESRSTAEHEQEVESVGEENQDEEENVDGNVDGENEAGVDEEAVSAKREAQDHEMEDAGAENTSDELEAAKARLQAKIQGPVDEDNAGDVAMQTRAMLDMVIMVVGEYYGQRDLLEAREIWQSS